jgi:hypothetical protein
MSPLNLDGEADSAEIAEEPHWILPPRGRLERENGRTPRHTTTLGEKGTDLGVMTDSVHAIQASFPLLPREINALGRYSHIYQLNAS